MLKNVSSDDQLLKLLSDIEYKDTILVIEDIDCMDDIIRERKNKYDSDLKINEEIEKLKKDMANIKENKSIDNLTEIKRELTLSGVLNAIDGVFDNDGRIMIMTTNHPDVLDKALIRPGRIDRKILFDYCTKKQIRGIYKMMFNKECNNYYITNNIDKVFSPAEVMSLFLRYKNKPEEAVKNFDKIEKDMEPIKHSLVSGIIDTNNKYSNKKQFNKSSGYSNQVIDDIYTSIDDI
jgi:SpoVK/Ycf46/Vps4 family AAA+-type ATPase